jgi:hypothetical protein
MRSNVNGTADLNRFLKCDSYAARRTIQDVSIQRFSALIRVEDDNRRWDAAAPYRPAFFFCAS